MTNQNSGNWSRRMVLGGLGWAYSVMLLTELAYFVLLDEAPDWRVRTIVIKLVVWTIVGLTFGRWAAITKKQNQAK